MISISEYASLSLQSYDVPVDGVSGSTVALSLTDTNFASEAESVGFSATAYNIDGKVVIAYRGTDQKILDVLEGWSTGAGFINQPQANLAIRFYQAVVAQFPTAEIELTGHSLGGGLAGYIAALYGDKAVLFDNMAFELAAATSADFSDPNSENYAPDLKQLIYGNSNPWPIDETGITAYAEEGEILYANRLGQTAPTTTISIGQDVDLTAIQRHYLPSLAIAIHAETLPTTITSNWETSSKYVFPQLVNNDDIAHKAGYADASKMARDIAYSAVGTAQVGTYAATSIFENLHELSVAQEQGILLGQEVSGLNSAFNDVGSFITGYAALLARAESKNVTSGNLLSVTDSHDILAVNIGETVWATETGATLKESLVEAILDEVYDYQAAGIDTILEGKFGDHALTNIGQIQLALGTAEFTGSVEDHDASLAVFIGTTSSDVIDGSAGSEIIFTANTPSLDNAPVASDTVDGKGGDDIIIGSSGEDHLNGGTGSDILIGGNGGDTLSGGTVTTNAGTPDETVSQDKAGDYLAGGLGNDTYEITGSFGDYGYYADGPYFNQTDAEQRTEAWYRLGLNYIDTIYDADGSGVLSIHYEVADQVFDEDFSLDAFETFVNVDFDSRPNAFYNAYEWGGTGSGIWQVDTGALTGVVYIDALNNHGGFSEYAILQAGYGNYEEGHSPIAAVELAEISLTDGVSASGEYLFAGTNGADILAGGSLNDQLFGAEGDDTLSGGSGDDYIDGGNGADNLAGDGGNDIILGRDGDDMLHGGACPGSTPSRPNRFN